MRYLTRPAPTGLIRLEEAFLADLAAQYGTPLYVYSEKQIRENVRRLKTAMSRHLQKFRIQYAIKANSNPHILAILKEEGVGADCSSPAELWVAQRVGFAMNRSLYSGNFESDADLEAARKANIIINMDDYHRLPDLAKTGLPEVLCFRINPGIGRGGFEGIVTGGTDAKFGVPYEETRQAFQTALKLGIRRFGVHMMTGSNNLEPLYFAEITQKLLAIVGEAVEGLAATIEFMDIGGGFGIPYSTEEKPLDVERTFELIAREFYRGVASFGLGDPELVVEPGRYLVGNAGVLLARVTHVKQSYRRFIGLDAGMQTLLRPALYKAFHRIWFDGKRPSGNASALVTGQICENSDIHPAARPAEGVRPGDLAAVLDVGAYGYAMSSNYNNRPRPAEVLVTGNSARLIRRRETDADIFGDVPDFP